MMKLYNTLTKKIDEITSIDPECYKFYSCGPTVYDRAHIGNISAFIYADLLNRALRTIKPVIHVMNYTDVDDKTIRSSRQLYPGLPPMEALHKLTQSNIELFAKDLTLVAIDLGAIKFVKATDYIDEIKTFVENLVQKGFAYIAEDGVYFSIRKYKEAGKKYGQLLEITDESYQKQRISNDEYSKSEVQDFVLWKKAKPLEPSWAFEIDGNPMAGRPGWHIECSVMSEANLGVPFDIHSGGIDLIFPHHENEIAQSTAIGENNILSTIFFHSNHVLVNDKKMAKSENNFITIADIVKRGYIPLSYRMMVLQSHYKNELHFSWNDLDSAQNTLLKWQQAADRVWQLEEQDDTSTLAKLDSLIYTDLRIPQCLSIIDSAFTDAEVWFKSPSKKLLKFIDEQLGLPLVVDDINNDQKKLLESRRIARDESNWITSDHIRQQLITQGIDVLDTPKGQIWKRNYFLLAS